MSGGAAYTDSTGRGSRRSLASRLILAVACLLGALGVAAGALAAHRPGAENLAIASSFLLFHAPAVLALGALRPASLPIKIAQAGLLLGVSLFSGALAADVLLGVGMSPSPAPWGGVLMMLSWLTASAFLLLESSIRRLP